MGKQSRRQRKHLRVKRGHVAARGTGGEPARSDEPSRQPRQTDVALLTEVVTADTAPVPRTGSRSILPIALVLVLGGIAALVALGLYRRYTEDAPTRGSGAAEATPANAVRQVTGPHAAAAAGSAEVSVVGGAARAHAAVTEPEVVSRSMRVKPVGRAERTGVPTLDTAMATQVSPSNLERVKPAPSVSAGLAPAAP